MNIQDALLKANGKPVRRAGRKIVLVQEGDKLVRVCSYNGTEYAGVFNSSHLEDFTANDWEVKG